jgi:hypothetical protein
MQGILAGDWGATAGRPRQYRGVCGPEIYGFIAISGHAKSAIVVETFFLVEEKRVVSTQNFQDHCVRPD